ncbi:MAG: riboflavin synthase, partial [Sphingomonadaceae bacterium]|nr:riboflavin synthase [Sphingomonadaceae bacterium]
MFTGIITDIGTVVAVEQRADLRVTIATAYDTAGIVLGASIACSGVCLTVVETGSQTFAVDVSNETLRHSAAAQWTVGARLNLERALKVGDELGGHIVTGHVDAVGTVAEIVREGGSRRLTIHAPASVAPFIAAKGSVGLSGVSLTVNEVAAWGEGGVAFTVNIIPHTAAQTS